MKIRNGFVSNSSSSSFAIDKRHVSSDQIKLIFDHYEEARKRELDGTYSQHIHCSDEWDISETDHSISGSVWMDNFDMENYIIEVVGVDPKHIEMDKD